MLIECLNCGTEYPPTATRWKCPGCGYKDTCCEGEPQKPVKTKHTLERKSYKRKDDFWENE
jgi:hypothetical protein